MGTRRPRTRQRRENKAGPLLFDDVEWATLTLAAERKGQETGAYIAAMALAVAREERTPVATDRRGELMEFMQARTALGRVGGNLNQAVRALNSGGSAPELEEVLELIKAAVVRLESAAAAVAGDRMRP